MKFDLQKAIEGHPLEYNGKPISLRAIRFDDGETLIYANIVPSEMPHIFHKDGRPATDDNIHPLTLAEPLREVHLVLYPGNEARYFYNLEAAQAALAGGKGSGPYTITAKLPWEISLPIPAKISLKA